MPDGQNQDALSEKPNVPFVDLLQQVSLDLSSFINSHSEPKKFAKILAEKMGVHEKTLFRIMNQENRPNYMTVLKMYRFILSEFDDAKVIEKAPPAVKDFLTSAIPQTLEKQVAYSGSVDNDIQKNPVVGEIYVLAATGPIKKSDVATRFGKYGLEIVEQMTSKRILMEVRPGELSLGPNQASLSNESLLSLGLSLTQNYAKAKNAYESGSNLIGFFAHDMSDEAYEQWLSIDKEAFSKKVALMKNLNYSGSKKVFTFMVTDTLEPKDTK